MGPETAKMLKEMEYEFFESDEYASTRAVLCGAPKNDGEPEDIDVVFDRIDKYAPAMREFVHSFLYASPTPQ